MWAGSTACPPERDFWETTAKNWKKPSKNFAFLVDAMERTNILPALLLAADGVFSSG